MGTMNWFVLVLVVLLVLENVQTGWVVEDEDENEEEDEWPGAWRAARSRWFVAASPTSIFHPLPSLR